MDNNPDNKPVDASADPNPQTNSQAPDVDSVSNFDQEPATGGPTVEATPAADPDPVVDVPVENPVPASSPFGPPIENLGTQPGFDTTPADSPVLNNSTASDTPNTKPISDVAAPAASAVPATPVAPIPPTPSVSSAENKDSNAAAPATPPAATSVPEAHSSQVADEKKAAKAGKKTAIKLPKQKKSHKGLFALLIILVVVVGGLVGGYFYLKNAADTAASNYTAKAKTYLNEVYDTAAISSTSDPAALKSSIDGITKPILEKPLLSDISFVSTKYPEAAKLNNQVVSQVNALTSTIMGLNDSYVFGTEYDSLSAEATTVSGTVTSDSTKTETLKMLADYQIILEKMQTLTEGAILPDSLAKAQSDLKTALTDEIAATKAQTAALTADKDDEYKAAKADLAAAAVKEASALDTIKAYNLTIPTQIESAAETLKSFIAGIKVD